MWTSFYFVKILQFSKRFLSHQSLNLWTLEENYCTAILRGVHRSIWSLNRWRDWPAVSVDSKRDRCTCGVQTFKNKQSSSMPATLFTALVKMSEGCKHDDLSAVQLSTEVQFCGGSGSWIQLETHRSNQSFKIIKLIPNSDFTPPQYTHENIVK